MNWDDKLSDAQKNSAKHIGSHARLLAGPGTGKTLVLTRRVLFLIQNEGISPDDILVLTFTRAAATELRQRISSALGDELPKVKISTLHSYALSMILREGAAMRLPQPIRIADDWEERNIIQEDIKSILHLPSIRQAQVLLAKLSADWEQLTADQPANRSPNPRFLGVWNEHREIFGYTLRAELVYQFRHALEEGHIRAGRPFRHVLIDEYQDLNLCELSVAKLLMIYGGELFVAGDDDQSIYGFRYANPEGIRNFENDFANSISLTLEECKRCGSAILEIANFVAEQDPRRYPKINLPDPDAPQSEVHILNFPNQQIEAQKVARICNYLHGNLNINLKDILILLRSDRNEIFSQPIREELKQLNLTVNIITHAHNCLDQDEGRILLCLLRLIVNDHDHLAWRTLLEIRANRVGKSTINELYEKSRRDGLGFSQIILATANDHTLIPRFGNRVASEVNSIEELISDLKAILLNSDGLMEGLINAATQLVGDRELRKEIIFLFEQVTKSAYPADLEDFLRAINTTVEKIEQDQKPDAISIMNMHQAKGLTAEAVIIVGAEDEYIPGRAHDGSSIGDEQRLLYVSLSRAKRYLCITHCHRRTGQQAHSGRNPGTQNRILTRFLRDGPTRAEDGISYVNNLPV